MVSSFFESIIRPSKLRLSVSLTHNVRPTAKCSPSQLEQTNVGGVDFRLPISNPFQSFAARSNQLYRFLCSPLFGEIPFGQLNDAPTGKHPHHVHPQNEDHFGDTDRPDQE